MLKMYKPVSLAARTKSHSTDSNNVIMDSFMFKAEQPFTKCNKDSEMTQQRVK